MDAFNSGAFDEMFDKTRKVELPKKSISKKNTINEERAKDLIKTAFESLAGTVSEAIPDRDNAYEAPMTDEEEDRSNVTKNAPEEENPDTEGFEDTSMEDEATKEEEKPVPMTKEYLGKDDEKHYYILPIKDEGTDEIKDLTIVDQDGNEKFSALDSGVDRTDVVGFLNKALEEVEITEIDRGVLIKYIFPMLDAIKDQENMEREELRDQEFEEENGEEGMGSEEEPMLPDEEELTIESKQVKNQNPETMTKEELECKIEQWSGMKWKNKSDKAMRRSLASKISRAKAELEKRKKNESKINEDYNGWKNYETWNVALWMTGNDQDTYNQVKNHGRFRSPQEVEQLVRSIFPNGTPDFNNSELGGREAYRKVDWMEILDSFNEITASPDDQELEDQWSKPSPKDIPNESKVNEMDNMNPDRNTYTNRIIGKDQPSIAQARKDSPVEKDIMSELVAILAKRRDLSPDEQKLLADVQNKIGKPQMESKWQVTFADNHTEVIQGSNRKEVMESARKSYTKNSTIIGVKNMANEKKVNEEAEPTIASDPNKLSPEAFAELKQVVFQKEKKEHPDFQDEQIEKIVLDHLKELGIVPIEPEKEDTNMAEPTTESKVNEMANLSRKHFVRIAALLKPMYKTPQVKQLIQELASFMHETNPNFNRSRFMDAAGMNEVEEEPREPTEEEATGGADPMRGKRMDSADMGEEPDFDEENESKTNEGASCSAKDKKQVKAIAKSEEKSGKSKKEAENIANATVNKKKNESTVDEEVDFGAYDDALGLEDDADIQPTIKGKKKHGIDYESSDDFDYGDEDVEEAKKKSKGGKPKMGGNTNSIGGMKKVSTKESIEDAKFVTIFPATSDKVNDNKNHYAINTEDQAKTALERVKECKDAPSWFKGTLDEMTKIVESTISSKYPTLIEKKEEVKEAKEEIVEELDKDDLVYRILGLRESKSDYIPAKIGDEVQVLYKLQIMEAKAKVYAIDESKGIEVTGQKRESLQQWYSPKMYSIIVLS